MTKETAIRNILDKVVISSKKRPGISGYDDETLKDAVYKKYPQIKEYQTLMNSINERYDWDNSAMKVWFEPNIKHIHSYTKFSIRYNSEFMNWPKETRKDWVNQYFEEHGSREWIEYDVNASIFRVTYLLNYGSWLSYSGDLYEYWYGGKFESREARKQFKQLCNIVYFTSSDEQAFRSYSNIYDVNDGYKPECLKYISNLRNRMTETIGRFYDSEIFMHESCVYIGAIKELYEIAKLRAIPVYDCFYIGLDGKLDGGKSELVMRAAILASAVKYYDDYAADLFGDYGMKPDKPSAK